MTMADRRRNSERGFSLLELVVVVGITVVLGGMAVVQISATRKALRGDSGMRVVMTQLVQAREAAITQRRNMRMVFDWGNRVQIIREEAPGPTTTLISSTFFEGQVQYVKTVADDTP